VRCELALKVARRRSGTRGRWSRAVRPFCRSGRATSRDGRPRGSAGANTSTTGRRRRSTARVTAVATRGRPQLLREAAAHRPRAFSHYRLARIGAVVRREGRERAGCSSCTDAGVWPVRSSCSLGTSSERRARNARHARFPRSAGRVSDRARSVLGRERRCPDRRHKGFLPSIHRSRRCRRGPAARRPRPGGGDSRDGRRRSGPVRRQVAFAASTSGATSSRKRRTCSVSADGAYRVARVTPTSRSSFSARASGSAPWTVTGISAS
jgi:hypothetical protein